MFETSKSLKESYTPEVALLEARINDIKTRVQMIGEKGRFSAGFYSGFVKGFMLGTIISIAIFTVLLAAL
ncbi:MAG: tetrahydromethanopterin S-methyltransferase subunit F [Thermoproteota archaeon]